MECKQCKQGMYVIGNVDGKLKYACVNRKCDHYAGKDLNNPKRYVVDEENTNVD